MVNLDFIQPLLPPAVTVVGFLDSPLWLDIEPLNPQTTSLQAETQAVYALVNATARLDDDCVAAYPDGATHLSHSRVGSWGVRRRSHAPN